MIIVPWRSLADYSLRVPALETKTEGFSHSETSRIGIWRSYQCGYYISPPGLKPPVWAR